MSNDILDRIAPANYDAGAPEVLYAGMRYVGLSSEELLAKGVPSGAILAGVKSRLCEEVDARAEQYRLRFLTPGVGQAMEYQEVQAQAMAVLSSPGATETATPAAYPMLAASIGTDIDPKTGQPAADVVGVARAVAASYAQWLAVGSAIRKWRMDVKASVNAAESIEDARSAAQAQFDFAAN